MTLPKKVYFKLIRCNAIFGLFLLLEIPWLATSLKEAPVIGTPDPSLNIGTPDQPPAIGTPEQPSIIGPPDQPSIIGPPAQPSIIGTPDQSSIIGTPGSIGADNNATGNNTVDIISPYNNESIDNNEMIQKLSERNLKFAFNIYKLMANRTDFVLSPFCLSVALTMTSFGAGNNTLQQITDALYLHGFDDHMKIAKAYNSILKSLDLKGDTILAISNRILIDESYRIEKPFKDVVTNEFRSEAKNVNFSDDGQTLNKEISEGLDQIARDKFKHLPSIVKGQTPKGAVLVSAIFFKGKWLHQFRQENTKPETWQRCDGCGQVFDIMNAEGMYMYAEDPTLDSKILQIEFSGERLLTYFILPNKIEGIKELKEKLTDESFKNFKNNLSMRLVTVKLPKFNCNFTKELSPELANLKIYDFGNNMDVNMDENAEPAMSGSHLVVKKVLHAADVEMMEEGTEAAARPVPSGGQAMGIGASSSSGGSISPVEFFATHPFAFIIYDKTTNFILFIGNVNYPAYV